MRAHIRQKGFTLIEAVLYMAVALGVVMAIFGLLQIILQGRARFMAEADGVGYAMWVGQQFVDKVERTDDISIPVPGGMSDNLEIADGQSISLLSGVLYLNSQPLTPASIKVASLSFMRTTESNQATMVRMSFTAISSVQGEAGNVINNHEYTFSATMLH